MTIEVLSPGLLTTVQDAGRFGLRALGVGSAGAADAYSARVANALVGNAAAEALLEITLSGPRLRFERGARIALAGADIEAAIGDVALPGWRPVVVPAGAELRLGGCRRGVRAYLAIEHGLRIDPVMGSASTDLRGGFGGVAGRALRAGDRLELSATHHACTRLEIAPWSVNPAPDLDLACDALAHLLPGSDATGPVDAIATQAWRVAAASDRQGLRLEGAALRLARPHHAVSEPVVAGTVQLPPDGQPIVLLCDAQTVGGYPRIGHVAQADLSRLAQCGPGDRVHFRPCTLAEAHALRRDQQYRLARMQLAIEHRGRALR